MQVEERRERKFFDKLGSRVMAKNRRKRKNKMKSFIIFCRLYPEIQLSSLTVISSLFKLRGEVGNKT